jgi:hypothetical protein
MELGTPLHELCDMLHNRHSFVSRIWRNLPADLRIPDMLAILLLAVIVLAFMFAWPYFGWGS